jgi:hypothetical protein
LEQRSQKDRGRETREWKGNQNGIAAACPSVASREAAPG